MAQNVRLAPGDELRMPTTFPTAKLVAAQLAVFITPLAWYVIAKYTPVPLPANAQSLLDALIQSAITGAIGMGAGWLQKPAARDVPVVVRKRTRRRKPVTRTAGAINGNPPPPQEPAGSAPIVYRAPDPLAAAEAEPDAADERERRRRNAGTTPPPKP